MNIKIIDTADVALMLYQSLKAYPCRCTFARTLNGRPIFAKGERITERLCSRCLALAAYERLHNTSRGNHWVAMPKAEAEEVTRAALAAETTGEPHGS